MNFNKTLVNNSNKRRSLTKVTESRQSVKLPCGHEFDMEFYKVSTINQIILNKTLVCIECGLEYKSRQSDILKNIYDNIKKEKKELRGNASIKKLSKEEFDTFKKFRKDYYISQLNSIKDCTKYFDLVMNMFNILFDTTYFLLT